MQSLHLWKKILKATFVFSKKNYPYLLNDPVCVCVSFIYIKERERYT